MDEPEPMTPDKLAAWGRALYGSTWQTDLANAPEIAITDTSRIRAMLTRKRRVPQGMQAKLEAVGRRRIAEIQAMLEGEGT